MSEHQEPFEQNVTEGWPQDAQNEELLKFAKNVNEKTSPLGDPAMERVRQRMRKEMDQGEFALRKQSPNSLQRLLILGGGLAAGVLLTLILMFEKPVNRTSNWEEAPEGMFIEDTISVRFAALEAPQPPELPLIPLENHENLFTP